MSYKDDFFAGATNSPTNESNISVQRGGESQTNLIEKQQKNIDDYDKRKHKKSYSESLAGSEDEKSPMYMAIYNMLAGCGIVGLPQTYYQAGLIPGVILMAIVAGFSVYTLRLLIKNARKVGVEDYETLCQKCWGVWGYYNLIASILLFDVGQCITYAIILGDSAHSVCSHLFGWSSNADRQLILCFAFVFLLLPMSIGKDFRFIEKISAFAIFSIVFMIGIVTVEYFALYEEKHEAVIMVNTKVTEVIQAFGAIAFAFSQQDQTFLVYKTLENPTVNRFTILSSWAMGIQFILCVFVGSFGYLSFGKHVKDDVLENYSASNNLVLGTRVLYTFTMAFIFPTAFYVVRHIAYSSVFYHSTETYEKASTFWRWVFTVGLLGFFLLISLFVEDLGLVMTLTGLLSVVNLTFILPCWIHLHLNDYPVMFWKAESGHVWDAFADTMPSLCLVVFGVLSAVVGVIGLFV